MFQKKLEIGCEFIKSAGQTAFSFGMAVAPGVKAVDVPVVVGKCFEQMVVATGVFTEAVMDYEVLFCFLGLNPGLVEKLGAVMGCEMSLLVCVFQN